MPGYSTPGQSKTYPKHKGDDGVDLGPFGLRADAFGHGESSVRVVANNQYRAAGVINPTISHRTDESPHTGTAPLAVNPA